MADGRVVLDLRPVGLVVDGILRAALPAGTVLRSGQRVEFGVAEGRRGVQALQVRVLDSPPTVAKASSTYSW